MTELFEPVDERDRRLALGASGLLAEFNRSGLIGPAEVHTARRLARLTGETDETVLLAVALAVRAVTHGSVCVDLRTVAEVAPELPWPHPDAWLRAVEGSAALASPALVLDDGLLYLARYYDLESQVCHDLVTRVAAPAPQVDETVLAASLDRLFPDGYAEQRDAAARAVRQWTTVLTGGPGTGKTTTVSGLLSALMDQAEALGQPLSIALTAPTGKAAARLQESIHRTSTDRERLQALAPVTLHRLLGWRPDNQTRFRHHRGNRLKHDVVVVDESSMVDLTLMARLLEALRPEARLVLVGDADQLSSVGAGAVLGDVVRGYAGRADSPVVELSTAHRFGEEIGALATALRDGDADGALAALRAGGSRVAFVETTGADAARTAEVLRPDLLTTARALRDAALAGDTAGALAALDDHRLICAHRDGPHGVAHWNRLVERWLGEDAGLDWWPQWYAGRPLLVTANDYGLGIHNGETGVVVRRSDGSLRGVVAGSSGPRDFAPTRLSDVETMHALTVHKSQGSQATRVTVLLPPEDSRLLSRELFYTAVTRAREHVRVVGSEAEVRAAVTRRAQRATGLAGRLARS